MEKVDLSRPGPVLPPSIDGVGETEEVERHRARLPADDASGSRPSGGGPVRRALRGAGGGARAGRPRPPRRGEPVADRPAAAARGGPRGGAARARARARRDQGARQPGDARSCSTLARQLRPTALDDLGLVAALGGARRAARRRGEVDADARRPSGDFSDLGDDVAARRLPGGPGGALQRRPPLAAPSASRCALRRARTTASSSTVADDGRGFAFDESERGLGIAGMRERALLSAAS